MATTNLQTTVLQRLVNDEKYCRKVLPFIKAEYFEGTHKGLYKLILDFITKYNRLPTAQALKIDAPNSDHITAEAFDTTIGLIDKLNEKSDLDEEWLVDQTEKWCKDRAIYLSIMESIQIIDGQSKVLTPNAIPGILQDALSVSFTTSVGHDFIDDASARWDFYHRKDEKIPFDLEMLNAITNGGMSKKSMGAVLASTGVGKSLFLCHLSASYLLQGRNVLYITLEMAEERIAERIDANLMGVEISSLEKMDKESYDNRIQKIALKTTGKLVIKEYPTASAHSGHFRALLNELKTKKKFIPDVICIDYLNICSSAKIKNIGGSVNSYTYIKSIAEELRALAVENNIVLWTATQSNRAGMSDTDIDLDNTSESFGTPMSLDFYIALISTEDLEKMNQLMVKQLKNRYNSVSTNKRFVIGIDRPKMKLYDVENKAQTLLAVNTPAPTMPMKNFAPKNSSFSGFKV